MSVLSRSGTALYGALKGGTALTALLAGTTSIYDTAAPDGATMPYVVFNHQGGGPDLITSKDIESNVWLIRGYTLTSAKAAAAIAGQIDGLLHKRNLSIGSATTFWCAREETITSAQQAPDNQRVWVAGGMYRIRTSGG